MSNSEQKSTEEVNFKMRRSFSWDKAFYTNGFLDDDELSSMIKGDGDDDLNHELQKIEEINNQESKLFQELEASSKKSTNLSSIKKDSQPKNVKTSQTCSSSSSPIKTIHPTRSSPSSTPARRSACSKSDKTTTNSQSKTSSPGITPKKKVTPVNTRVSRTSPASPVSSVSSPSPSSSSPSSSKSSKFGVNQRSKRGSSVPCRSSMNNEKSSSIKTTKPAVKLIPKTQSSITLKIKPPPESSVSSSTHVVNQKSKLKGDKRSTVQHRSKSTNYKQPVPSRTETRNPNASKPRKLLATKTVAAVNATVKPSKKQSKAKSLENMICISPEVLDIKGKLNALKMEIRMQKKERSKETKMGHDENVKGESSSIIRMNNKTKPI